MRTKKVNRYYCDFCKKSGGMSYHMKRHEAGCTLNPNRVCGLCKFSKRESKAVKLILEALPKREPLICDCGPDEKFMCVCHWGNKDQQASDLKALRDATEDCPACILAAIRQGPLFLSFDFKKELEAFWEEENNLRAMDQ